MNKEELRIVYMGTPDFAVESLRCLVDNGYNIVGVVTMPDKPVGRHQTELSLSPVKQYAMQKGLRILQPEKLKDPVFIEELRSLRADLQIVVAFRMLPEIVWNMPRLGTFNLHAALLPQYRGAAPINWAVINGDTTTGVTTFFLDHHIDTGRIIRRESVPISDTDNAGDVHDRLMVLGARLVTETVDDILSGRVSPVAQDELSDGSLLRPAPKIFKETCRINWNQGIKQAYDFIRGLAPYPAAWTVLTNGSRQTTVKIYETEKESCLPDVPCGTVVTNGRDVFKVALADGFLHLKVLQMAGKKRMSVAEFLRGFHAESVLGVE